MGWWSTQIMGGDHPMDRECDIFAEIGIKPSRVHLVKKENIRKRLIERLPNLIESFSKRKDDDLSISFQVLAFVLMKYGVPISQEVKDNLIEKISLDEWAKEEPERAKNIHYLIEDLKSYEGEPQTTHQRGLFETMLLGKQKS